MFEKVLDFQANQTPNALAMITSLGEMTYGDLWRNVSRFATAFRREGLSPDEIALVTIANSALAWTAALALERVGVATVVTDKIAEGAHLVQPHVVITDMETHDAPEGVRVIVMTAAWRRQALSEAPSGRSRPAHPDDLVRIVLSSGTTGTRKQIPLTRRIVDARVAAGVNITTPSNVRFLNTMGADTISGFQRPLTTWARGGVSIHLKDIDEAALRRCRPNLASISPARLHDLLDVFAKVYTADDPIRVVVGGSAMPPPLIRRAMACPGVNTIINYGSTEAGTTAFGPATLALERPGAVGYVTPWSEVEVLDEDGRPLPFGESGEIRIRGVAPIDAYRGELDRPAVMRDGWFYPGDRGALAADGLLTIEGRTDDVINVGGVKLSATAIEHLILECPGVTDAAAIAAAMASGGSRAFAGVVGTGYEPGEIVRRVAQGFGIQIGIVPLTSIPRNAMGKISRARVMEAIAQAQQPLASPT